MTVELTVVCKPQHSPVVVVVNYNNSKSLTIVYNQRCCGVNNDNSNNIINYNTIQFHRLMSFKLTFFFHTYPYKITLSIEGIQKEQDMSTKRFHLKTMT